MSMIDVVKEKGLKDPETKVSEFILEVKNLPEDSRIKVLDDLLLDNRNELVADDGQFGGMIPEFMEVFKVFKKEYTQIYGELEKEDAIKTSNIDESVGSECKGPSK